MGNGANDDRVHVAEMPDNVLRRPVGTAGRGCPIVGTESFDDRDEPLALLDEHVEQALRIDFALTRRPQQQLSRSHWPTVDLRRSTLETGVRSRAVTPGTLRKALADLHEPESEFAPGSELSVDVAVRTYRDRAAKTDAAVRSIELDHRSDPSGCGEGKDLRWVLLHLINETARHAGHADPTRELLDGATGE